MDIKVTARDEAGRQAEVVFRPLIDAGSASQQAGPAGTTGQTVSSASLGFPVQRLGNESGGSVTPSGTAEHRLFVYQGVRDATSESSDRYEYRVPRDAFAHTDPGAVVRLQATLVDGSPLPSWLTFDPVSGTLSGTPPNGETLELEIKMTARDNAGREANVIFAPVISGAPAPASPSASDRTTGDQAAIGSKLLSGGPLSSRDDAGVGLKLGGDAVLSQGGLAGLAGASSETGGFAVARVDADTAAANGLLNVGSEGHRLFVYHGISDLRFSADLSFSFSVPVDAFAHTDPNASVLLEARLSSGESLPSWMSFNAVTGLFSGKAPSFGMGYLDIEITARDEDGRIARLQFRLDLNPVSVEDAPAEKTEAAAVEAPTQMYDKDIAAAEAENGGEQVVADADAAKKAKAEIDKIKRGAVSFSEQAMAAKAQRDPILARILASHRAAADKPVNPA